MYVTQQKKKLSSLLLTVVGARVGAETNSTTTLAVADKI
jgi:hypothetical protein